MKDITSYQVNEDMENKADEMIVEVSPLRYRIKVENKSYFSEGSKSSFQYLELTPEQMEKLLNELKNAIESFKK